MTLGNGTGPAYLWFGEYNTVNDLKKKYRSEINELAAAARRLGELGHVASHGGNLSYKVADDVILITPTKVLKSNMQGEDIVAVRADGSMLWVEPGKRPTGETPMHTHLYRKRPDINALVHAHPPALTGFSLTESDILSRPLLPEPVIEVGPILTVNYAEPITDDLADEFDTVVARSNAWLMRNHGVTLCSTEGPARAVDLLEMIEAMAVSVSVGLTVGEITEMSHEDVENLENTIRTRNMPHPGDPRVIRNLTDMYFPLSVY
jgi:L-fuculose-phosphate aldolase